MKLLFIIGNSSVGKMTVGQELAKITDLRLFHNHMTIEPIIELFGDRRSKLISEIRELIFREFAASDHYGMIFTYMWAFNEPSEWAYVERISGIFREVGAEVYYTELVASQEARLERNTTENRLQHKPSKRDIEASTRRLLSGDTRYRLVSNDGEIPYENYIKIDNTHLPPDAAAAMIRERFAL